MAIENQRLSVERRKYDRFITDFKAGKFKGLRLGQAWYNHMNLHRVVDQAQFQNLYEKDGQVAIDLIKKIFKFN